MTSPALETIIELLQSRPVDDGASIQEMRAGLEAMVANAPPPTGVRREMVSAGGVPAEWIVPDGVAGDATILYLHGGGYVMGSIASHRGLVARLSETARARGLLIDYRLAPEHPFPAAVDDATAAYRWLLAQGVPASRLVVAGDSAGGGLTVATLVALRDARVPLPAAGVCLSPWVDLEAIGESMQTKASVDPMLDRARLLRMAAAYLAGAPPRTPLAAPLWADLAGLPPLLVQVGTRETLLDDAVRLAERARAAGVTVTLEPWDGMIHVFQAFAPLLPEADEAIARIGAFVRPRLAG